MLCTPAKCSLLYVKPKQIFLKFKIFETNKLSKKVSVINLTKNLEFFEIRFPITKYFLFKLPLQKRYPLRAERVFHIEVHLAKLAEQRIYYDCFYVICKNGCAHGVKLEAIPVLELLSDVPREIKFGHVPLGELANASIQLHPMEQSTNFFIIGVSNNPDFAITPTRGALHKQPMIINVFYKPSAYITFTATMYLYIPKLMSTPLCITVTAHTKPGYLRDQITEEVAHLKAVKYYDQLISKKKKSYRILKEKRIVLYTDDLKLKQEDIQKILYQSPFETVREENELLGPLGNYLDFEQKIKLKKEKEFLEKVAERRKKNDVSYYGINLRELDLFDDHSTQRMIEWESYRLKLTPPINWETICGPEFIRQRIVENYKTREPLRVDEQCTSNLWFIRYIKMIKFIDAGRKIILKNRLLKVLSVLKNLKPYDVELMESEEIFIENLYEEVNEYEE